ncbi:MAG: PPE domain-containing protein [Kibdelosporangium sp.]
MERRNRYKSEDQPGYRPRTSKRVRRQRDRSYRHDGTFPAGINWRHWRHTQLWDMIKSAAPPQLGQVAHKWGTVASGVDTTTAEIHDIVQKLMHSWKGPSAIQAAQSVTALTRWGAEACQTAYGVGRGLDAYTSAVERARNRMPEPVHYNAERAFEDGYDIKALDGPNGLYIADNLINDQLPTKRQAEKAYEEAIEVMREYESASRETHETLPSTFAPAPPVTSTPVADPSPIPAPPNSRPPLPAPTVPTTPIPLSVPDTGPATTTTASAVPTEFGYPSGPGAGAGSGTGPGTLAGGLVAGGGGAGGFSGGPGGVAGGGGARAGAGVGVGPTGMPGASQTTATTSAARGAAGSTAMYPPVAGAGASGDDELEHKNKWGEGLDLLDDMPPAFPSVLGE